MAWLGSSPRTTPIDELVLRGLGAFCSRTRTGSRFNPSGRPVPLPPGNGATTGTFLLDGRWEGTWQLRDGVLRPQPYDRIDLEPLMAEAAALRSWLAPGSRIVVEGLP